MKKTWFAQVDVSEQQFLDYDRQVLETLLIDRTTGNNILWGTYSLMGRWQRQNQQIADEPPADGIWRVTNKGLERRQG